MKTLLRLLCPLFVIVVAYCAESDFMVGRFKSVGSRAEYSPKNSIGDYKITAYNTVYTNFNFNGEQNSTTTGTIATLNTSDEPL